eukprot:scaffold16977_cov69-Phaeocystis_antarctica.AAC.1
MATPAYNSPYRAFCREQRPLLPTGMKNSDREKALGQMWRAHQRRKGHIPSRPEARAFVRPRRTPRLGSRSASQ